MHLARVRLRGRKEEKKREMTRLGTSRANITHTPNISCDRENTTTSKSMTHTQTKQVHVLYMYTWQRQVEQVEGTYTRHHKSPQVSLHWQSYHLQSEEKERDNACIIIHRLLYTSESKGTQNSEL